MTNFRSNSILNLEDRFQCKQNAKLLNITIQGKRTQSKEIVLNQGYNSF